MHGADATTDADDAGEDEIGDDAGEDADHAVEVEAVESLADSITTDAPEYVLYGGKGGVGKTTMAAATGLASALSGTPTLVVSTDPAHSLSDALETDVPERPARLREDAPLWGVEIDPDEAAAVQQLMTYLDDERFERVVVDTAPTGHTLRLLELPEVLDSMAGKLLSIRERFQGMMEGVTGMFGGEGDDAAGGTADLSELRERVERLRTVLRDPTTTDFRVVMVPETMSVTESERLLSRLSAYGVPVSTVVVNRVMEPASNVADVDPDAFVSPDLDSCAFCQRRWEVQREALADAQDAFRGHDVRRVPLFADEVRGERMLQVVAACLSA